MGAASEVTPITNKRKMGAASDESSPTTKEKPNVQSTDMDIVVGEDGSPTMKKIKIEEVEQSPKGQEMKIYMKIIKTISLGVISSDTIKDVKAKYRNMVGDTSNEGELFFAGDHLKNDKKLIDNGIQDGSTVHMFLLAEARMQIRIKSSIDGKEHKLEVLKRDTVQNIKAVVRNIWSYRISEQLDLIYNGKQLEDCQTLIFYNIQHDSTLCAVFADDDRIELKVNTPKNGMVAFEVKLEYTLEDVKMMIESMGMPMDKHELLIYADGLMYDHLTLRELKIDDGTRMDVVPYRKSNVHSTNMQVTAAVPSVVKKIKVEGSLESPMSQEMKIYVKVMKTIALGVNSSDSIEDVKVKYRSVEGDTSNDQELFFSGDNLRNNKKLIDYGVQDGYTVHMFLHSDAKMQIQIKMRNESNTKLDVLKWDTIQKIKSMILKSTYGTGQQVDLIYSGKQLEDCRTLAFYNIHHDSILHAVTVDEDRFDLRIKTPSNGIISFKVNLSYTIEDVKLMIESMLGIPIDRQELVFSTLAGLVYDHQTLKEWNVTSGTMIELQPFRLFHS